MIPVGQPYRPDGPINFRSLLSTLILGTVTALLGAAAIWLWETSPVPTFVLVTPALQGVLIGLVLAIMIGRLRMRNPKLLATIAVACGLSSVALVHYGHYLRFLDTVGEQYRTEVEADRELTPDQKRAALARVEHGSHEVADTFLVAKTGHPGLVGSLLLRSEMGVQIKHSTLTGWGVWLLWGVEAFIVAATAGALAGSRAAEPFCEECVEWCAKHPGRLDLVGEAAAPLAEAIRGDNTAEVVALRDRPIETAGNSAAGTSLKSCPGCDQTFADVWHRIDKPGKKGKTESTTRTLVKQLRISPEMAQLLRSEPEPAAETAEV